jgi:hypothetical protein
VEYIPARDAKATLKVQCRQHPFMLDQRAKTGRTYFLCELGGGA